MLLAQGQKVVPAPEAKLPRSQALDLSFGPASDLEGGLVPGGQVNYNSPYLRSGILSPDSGPSSISFHKC